MWRLKASFLKFMRFIWTVLIVLWEKINVDFFESISEKLLLLLITCITSDFRTFRLLTVVVLGCISKLFSQSEENYLYFLKYVWYFMCCSVFIMLHSFLNNLLRKSPQNMLTRLIVGRNSSCFSNEIVLACPPVASVSFSIL